MQYESVRMMELKSAPGVRVTITRMSFGRRIELMQQVRDLGSRIEFLEAGNGFKDKVEANILWGQIDRLFLQWGLRAIDGLTLDGKPATPEALVADGPEDVCREVLEAIKRECGLTEEERKN
jgi:hypothetical protein